MSPADRAALAARLREAVGLLAFPGGSAERDLLAAAAELERPRPRVEWRRHATVRAFIGEVGGYRIGRLLIDGCDHAPYIARLTAAGFDVAPLPEVPRA